MWILDQLEPGSFAYNLATALRLHGRLETAALGAALAEIVRRHEALRTVFAADGDGEPRQVILPAGERPLPLVDLTALPAPARAAEAGRLAAEDALRPFDLVRGPLLRTTLLRQAEGEHVLLLSLHHVITDGWSIGIFTRELTELYRAFAAGAPSPLRELPLQYADFAVWQRGWLRGEALEEQLRYWRRHLAGAPPVLELPADRPRPATQSHRGGRSWLTLPRDLTARLAAESRRLEVTPFMTLLGAFATLLLRYGGEADLVIGTPIANRSRHELEELIGFFANTLALRVGAGGDPTFADLAHRVREAALGAYAHQDLPFERLVDELQPERNLGHAPIFQVMLTLQNAPPPMLELGGLDHRPPGGRGGAGAVRSLARPDGGRRRAGRPPGPQLRSLRRGDRRADARPLRSAGRRRPGGPGGPALGPDAAVGRRAAGAPRHLERHAGGLPGRADRPRAGRDGGPALPRSGGGLLRRPDPPLRRAGGAGEPARPPADPPGGRPRGPGRPLPPARAGDAGRPAGRAQGRRRLRAARPEPPPRAPGLDPGGREGAGPAGRPRLARGPAGARRAGDRSRGGRGGRRARRAVPAARPAGESRLRDLHLRLHRPAEGGGGAPSRGRQLPDVDGAPPGAGGERHGAGADHALVRHPRHRAAAAARRRGADRAGRPRDRRRSRASWER